MTPPSDRLSSSKSNFISIYPMNQLFTTKFFLMIFFRKVYSILMLQLLVTFTVAAWMTYHVPTKQFAHENMGIFLGAAIMSIVMVIVIVCCSSVRRKTPINYIFLFAFTIAEAILLGYVSSVMKEKYVSK